jgi:hypothetical protein
VNVQVNAPPADVANPPAVQVAIDVDANLIVTVLLTVKPDPDTVTELPTGPCVGTAALTVGVVTVYVVVGARPEFVSVTVIV